MQTNRNTLIVLVLVMLINALSYGTIIPLLYPYAARFGINPVGLSLLFASFSIAQFVATPIIGRLSDQYGRKPILLLSLFGTCLSLALFASASSVSMLFIARILDGITGGNISVAQAVIADSTTGKDRAKSFGLLGASFGFGFLLGPAIGGLLSTVSLTAPFWFASGLALAGTIVGLFLLPETLDNKQEFKARTEDLFHLREMVTLLKDPVVGVILVLTFITSVSQNTFILGFQSYTVDVLKLSAQLIGLLFSLFGIVNIVMQIGGVRLLLNKISSKRLITRGALLFTSIVLISMSFSANLYIFATLSMLYAVGFAPLMVMFSALISERTQPEDQGVILGINQSYMSLGQIIGPLFAGLVTTFSVPAVFTAAGVILFGGLVFSQRLNDGIGKQVDIE